MFLVFLSSFGYIVAESKSLRGRDLLKLGLIISTHITREDHLSTDIRYMELNKSFRTMNCEGVMR